jgi:membrane protease YdiL (CAAX protease family)
MGLIFINTFAHSESPISIVIVILLYSIYYLLVKSKLNKIILIDFFRIKRVKVYGIILQRVTGFLLFGILPAVLILINTEKGLFDYGLNLKKLSTSLIWIGILTPVILGFSWLASRSKKNLAQYPQIRENEWNISLLFLSSLSWIIYLIGYEFMFRGFLLFNCHNAYGILAAVIINTVIYSLVHFHKGLGETIGAIPLGVILSLLTLKTGSIMIALVVHILMALSNEWFSIGFNPEIKVIINKRS